jgi:calcineurin-like phosphoesterase family protein
MNDSLVRNWNERIKEEDTVYHIGDFCFKNSDEQRGEGQRKKAIDWIRELNGQKVFIKGNHDNNNSLKTLIDCCTITYAGNSYFLVHDPAHASIMHDINFTGHVHQNWKYRKYMSTTIINVGVDVNNFMPKTIDEILHEYKHWLRNNKLEVYAPFKKEYSL